PAVRATPRRWRYPRAPTAGTDPHIDVARGSVLAGRRTDGKQALDAPEEHGRFRLAIRRDRVGGALVQLRMPLRQDLAHLFQYRVVLLQDGLKRRFAHGDDFGFGQRADAGAARVPRHNAHLAEAFAWSELGHVCFASGTLQHHSDPSAIDDEHLIAAVALVDD